MSQPTISAVMRVYNGERYIEAALESVLAQSRPADEVIVVDDGSTDGTAAVLDRFSGQVRVVKQANSGYVAAMNRCFALARCSHVAICDADDIWEPQKLERQAQAVAIHPQIDIAFSGISVFGALVESRGLHTAADASLGMLDGRRLARSLYRENVICPSSTLIRRGLYEQLGPFNERLASEDYDYWMRALRADAAFYYDPARLTRYRTHAHQLTRDALRTRQAMLEVHELHADLIGDRAIVDPVLRDDFFKIGRYMVEEGRDQEARLAFRDCLRHGRRDPMRSANARAAIWMAILGMPVGGRGIARGMLTRASRALDGVKGGRSAVLP